MKTLIVIAISFVSLFARADWNPADNVSSEIRALALDALRPLRGKTAEIDTVLDAMIKQVPKVRAYMTDEKLIADSNGQTQDSVAMNFPKLGLIVINRARWAKITSLVFRRAIALHEVGSLMNLESTGVYNFSSAYVSLAGLSPDDFKRALTSESSTVTADGLSATGCPWAADRLSFFWEVWASAVDTCQNQTGLIYDQIASFKEQRLRGAMKIALRNCSTEAKVLSDVALIDSLIASKKAARPAACTQ